ncbi:MAG: class I SAM-dependent methyltransferase [Candidatus Ranarchaeia archaeon]
MDKDIPITQHEIQSKIGNFNPYILSLIDDCREKLGLNKEELKILDYGCGRGKNVAALLEMGFDAYGVDIDPVVVSSAQRGMTSERHRFLKISDNNLTPFKNATFHFVMTEHVIEHVRLLSNLVSELGRIIKVGGYLYNVYPPYGRIIEPHVHMPFVQYLSPGLFRDFLIYIFTIIGIHPKWKQLPAKDLFEVYKFYLDNKVYHRNNKSIKQEFTRFFECSIVTSHNQKVFNKVKNLVFSDRITRLTCRYLVSRFFICHLLCIKKAKIYPKED